MIFDNEISLLAFMCQRGKQSCGEVNCF